MKCLMLAKKLKQLSINASLHRFIAVTLCLLHLLLPGSLSMMKPVSGPALYSTLMGVPPGAVKL